ARRFCGRLPPRMKSRSMVSSMSDFLMTLRPFFFLGAPSAAAASVPGAGSAPRAAGDGAGAVGLRRSILPRTFTPRISSNPGGGGRARRRQVLALQHLAGRAPADHVRAQPGLGRLLARRDEVVPAGVALGHDPLRDDPLGANRHRRARYEPERLAHALHFLVG